MRRSGNIKDGSIPELYLQIHSQPPSKALTQITTYNTTLDTHSTFGSNFSYLFFTPTNTQGLNHQPQQ